MELVSHKSLVFHFSVMDSFYVTPFRFAHLLNNYNEIYTNTIIYNIILIGMYKLRGQKCQHFHKALITNNISIDYHHYFSKTFQSKLPEDEVKSEFIAIILKF